MQIIFNKYHGTGNDFILIDNREHKINPGHKDFIERLCMRHTGIGADGLILIYGHEKHDFEMKYFNSDGRESTMCGNGGRCAVAFAEKTGISKGKGSFLAADGVHRSKAGAGSISISLMNTKAPRSIDGNHFIDTGSPHYIISVPDANKVDVRSKGRLIRNSDIFAPTGTNVNFVEYHPDHIYVRTYEKGVENETLSCGTGVTAAAIAHRWSSGIGKYRERVISRGGELIVEFEINGDRATNIRLTGPAEFVFAGVIDI